MTLQNFVDVLETSELMPINVFQPGVNPDDEREQLIQFVNPEIIALKDIISGADVAKIEINKITKGPVTKQDVKVEINVELENRVI